MKAEVGDRVLVGFLEEPDQEYFEKSDWPYHVTLLGWYSVSEGRLGDWHERLSAIARATPRLEVAAGDEAYFGVHHNELVRRLPESRLKPLHFRLLNNLAGIGHLRDDRYSGNSFNPHVTQQYTNLIDAGDKLVISSLSEVLKIEPDIDQFDRQVVASFQLAKGNETAA